MQHRQKNKKRNLKMAKSKNENDRKNEVSMMNRQKQNKKMWTTQEIDEKWGQKRENELIQNEWKMKKEKEVIWMNNK